MFCSPDLASRIDRAEASLCAAIALNGQQPGHPRFVGEVGGGFAIYAGDGSPTNKMIGLGFDGPVEADELTAVERAFGERGARLQAEVSTLASPQLHALLVERGYVPSGFENVLGHQLQSGVGPVPPGIRIEPLEARDLPRLADVITAAFASPDEGGVGGDVTPPEEELRKWFLVTMAVPGFRGYVARLDGGEIAGGAALRIDGSVAQFSGAGTLPQFRRRGVQTALLRARLLEAARAGCEVGVVVTQPASKSQQNVQREGFALLYARQLLVKAPPA